MQESLNAGTAEDKIIIMKLQEMVQFKFLFHYN